jgi:hydroxymethylglutaryl-CoA lyase
MTKRENVSVREVGPRDGLQMARETMATEAKMEWIGALADAGVRQIEVGSFVPATMLPQMADSATVVRTVRESFPHLYASVLAPNLRGVQDAIAAGAQSIIVPISASEAHSRANVRKSREEQVLQFGRMAELIHSLGSGAPRIEAAVSTAFGCSMEGKVSESDVTRLAAALARAGADVVTLADTLGYATPSHVRRLVRAVRSEIGAERFGALHLHDTLGTALANVMAGLEEDVRAFDGALGGIGGCPFAPGSVGNVATEDLVYLLESESFDTGIDLKRLLEARTTLSRRLPNERLHGRVAAAGIPRTYSPARKT